MAAMQFKGRLSLLNRMSYLELSDLSIVVLEAAAQAKSSGSSVLDMRHAGELMSESSVGVYDLKEAIEILQGAPSKGALNLVRAIADIMETAKVG